MKDYRSQPDTVSGSALRIWAISALIGLAVAASAPALAADRVYGESDLLQLIQQDHPQSWQWQLQKNGARLQQVGFQERFDPRLESKVGWQKSFRNSINPASPSLNPAFQSEAMVKQQLPYGVGLGAGVFADQVSTLNGQLDQATGLGIAAELSVDLWKNFFGRLDRLEAKSLALNTDATELRIYLQKKTFQQEIRKIYWALVANEESRLVAEEMQSLAETQLKEAQRRRQLSVADSGEVARYAAQLKSTEATLAAIHYQKEKYLLSLKTILPSLAGQDIAIKVPPTEATIAAVNQCTATIKAEKEVPFNHTKTDELLAVLEKKLATDRVVVNSHDDMDIKIIASGKYAGDDNGTDQAIKAFHQSGQPEYGVALAVSIPLGKSSERTKMARLNHRYLELARERANLEAQLTAHHHQIGQLIDLLYSTIALRQDNTSLLSDTIKDSQRKFDQARIGVDQVIRDQNAWQASRLEQIETKLLVMHELLDYFAVFTETPCHLNNI